MRALHNANVARDRRLPGHPQLERLGVHSNASYDPRVVAAICVLGMGMVFLATRIKRVPLSAKIVLAAGGVTYPLYLLHMQLGYVIFTAVAPRAHVLAMTSAIVVGAFVLAYGVWRFLEPAAHRSKNPRRVRRKFRAFGRREPGAAHPRTHGLALASSAPKSAGIDGRTVRSGGTQRWSQTATGFCGNPFFGGFRACGTLGEGRPTLSAIRRGRRTAWFVCRVLGCGMSCHVSRCAPVRFQELLFALGT